MADGILGLTNDKSITTIVDAAYQAGYIQVRKNLHQMRIYAEFVG